MGSIKSRPIYQPLRFVGPARAHLLVTDLARVPEDCSLTGSESADLEIWVVALQAPGIASEASGRTRPFRAVAGLRAHLAHRLAREPVGLRLYALGSESFLWDVMNLAQAAGMSPDEVCLSHSGTLRRRVYCAHCKTLNDDVETNIVRCRGCGASLFVRDHFSRRLAAFMGVMADAEVPGELPERTVLYP